MPDDTTACTALSHEVRTCVALDLDAVKWSAWQSPATWPVGDVVYTLADDLGVFYVGITANVPQRMSAHRSRRAFGRRARYVRAITVNSREEAEWVERQMIYLFDPSENQVHRQRRVV